jgi:transcriptional regulator with XRE-family HTH domain
MNQIDPLFGEILKQLRVEKGISQEHLAELADVDRTYISLLERGLRQPTISMLFKLAKALKTSPSKILIKLEKLYAGK